MKKLLLFIFAINLFGFEINENKIFKINYTPTNFSTNITLMMSNKNLNPLINNITSLPKNNYCHLKNYSISPIFNKKSAFINYNAYVYINCNLNKNSSKTFDKYLKNLSKLGKIKISSIEPKNQNHSKILKLKAYNYGINLAKNISKKLHLKCFIKSVSFNHFIKKSMPSFRTFSMPMPQNTKTEQLKAYYNIECLE